MVRTPLASARDIDVATVIPVAVSPRTTWLFLRATNRDGLAGVGEITCFGHEAAVAGAVADMLWARPDVALEPDAALVTRVAASGLEQARIDLEARVAGIPAAEQLASRSQEPVRAYANINRGTVDRSPQGHARRAVEAVSAGYDALKLAPFDDVGPDGKGADAVAYGIDCVFAVRDAVGKDVAINVDCHARFDEASAREMIRSVAAAEPFWIEEPLPETVANASALRRLRHQANARGIRLAGGENDAGIERYRMRVAQGGLDVMLPDIRFCGGVAEALRIAEVIAGAGLAFSLHNPVGPVLDAISRRVAAVAPSLVMLERTFVEAPIQAVLTLPPWRDPGNQNYHDLAQPGWGTDIADDARDRVGLRALRNRAALEAAP